MGLDQSQVFPGEDWFFYWKTSASLWETKIAEKRQKRVLVPINWAFHSETGDSYDFGTLRPETDLKRLADICETNNVSLVFLLPLTPLPYLTNGGIPHLLARNVSVNPEGVTWSFAQADGCINKLFSFFDPRVYEGYLNFVEQVGTVFSQEGVQAPVWGIEAGSMLDGQFVSYLADQSKTFDKAFMRFLNTKGEREIIAPAQEVQKKEDFFQKIRQLYIQGASDGIGANWEGYTKIAFLDGSCRSFINKIWGIEDVIGLYGECQEALSVEAIPSSILLEDKKIDNTFRHFLNESSRSITTESFFRSMLEDGEIFFRLLRRFEVFQMNGSDWTDLALWDYLQNEHPWSFYKSDYSSRVAHDGAITLCQGKSIDADFFNYILKRFLNGYSIIIDKDELPEELRKKLMLFILENSLKTEKVNKYTLVTNVILGDGRLMLFEGHKLNKLSLDKRKAFWDLLFSTFEIRALMQENTSGIESLWFSRDAVGSELNFEEIRRLNLYNRTSYKKRERIKLPKNAVLIKVSDEFNAEVKSGSGELDINLLPAGHATIDFGFYS